MQIEVCWGFYGNVYPFLIEALPPPPASSCLGSEHNGWWCSSHLATKKTKVTCPGWQAERQNEAALSTTSFSCTWPAEFWTPRSLQKLNPRLLGYLSLAWECNLT